MDQMAEVVWGLLVVIGILIAFGSVAMAFGADSRPCIGDSHMGPQRGDWI